MNYPRAAQIYLDSLRYWEGRSRKANKRIKELEEAIKLADKNKHGSYHNGRIVAIHMKDWKRVLKAMEVSDE